MLPISNTTVTPGATETQQMRVVAPVGVSRLTILFLLLLTIFIRAMYVCGYESRTQSRVGKYKIKWTFQDSRLG